MTNAVPAGHPLRPALHWGARAGMVRHHAPALRGLVVDVGGHHPGLRAVPSGVSTAIELHQAVHALARESTACGRSGQGLYGAIGKHGFEACADGARAPTRGPPGMHANDIVFVRPACHELVNVGRLQAPRRTRPRHLQRDARWRPAVLGFGAWARSGPLILPWFDQGPAKPLAGPCCGHPLRSTPHHSGRRHMDARRRQLQSQPRNSATRPARTGCSLRGNHVLKDATGHAVPVRARRMKPAAADAPGFCAALTRARAQKSSAAAACSSRLASPSLQAWGRRPCSWGMTMARVVTPHLLHPCGHCAIQLAGAGVHSPLAVVSTGAAGRTSSRRSSAAATGQCGGIVAAGPGVYTPRMHVAQAQSQWFPSHHMRRAHSTLPPTKAAQDGALPSGTCGAHTTANSGVWAPAVDVPAGRRQCRT
jgi:hypothetical protein